MNDENGGQSSSSSFQLNTNSETKNNSDEPESIKEIVNEIKNQSSTKTVPTSSTSSSSIIKTVSGTTILNTKKTEGNSESSTNG